MSSIRSQQTAQIKIEKTGEVIEVVCDDLPWDVMPDDEEREMGPELVHYAEFAFDGGTAIWNVWEYPEGCLNYCEPPHIEGGTLVRDFRFSLSV